MDAYEIAKSIDNNKWQELVTIEEIADMLCDQADEIVKLQKLLSDSAYEKAKELYDELQIKELSDKEIIEIRDSCYAQSGIDEWEFDDVVFARAILKKANEK
jgi:hypothetical protein